MSLERTKRSIKMRLLATVLALALSWYLINPAPVSPRRERKADPPDTGRHRLQADVETASLSRNVNVWRRPVIPSAIPLDDQGDEPFDWPEFIEVD
jgi:hypothetical protein